MENSSTDVHTSWEISPWHVEKIPLKKLLKKQFRGQSLILPLLSRVDILVRARAARNYLNNTPDFTLYEKMQSLRSGKEERTHQTYKFKKLINSFNKKGFDKEKPIPCNKSYQILDGSHRLALSYIFHMEYVYVKVVSGKCDPADYSISWFQHNKLSKADIGAIELEYNKLLSFLLEEIE